MEPQGYRKEEIKWHGHDAMDPLYVRTKNAYAHMKETSDVASEAADHGQTVPRAVLASHATIWISSRLCGHNQFELQATGTIERRLRVDPPQNWALLSIVRHLWPVAYWGSDKICGSGSCFTLWAQWKISFAAKLSASLQDSSRLCCAGCHGRSSRFREHTGLKYPLSPRTHLKAILQIDVFVVRRPRSIG